jgi:hypothetical protein
MAAMVAGGQSAATPLRTPHKKASESSRLLTWWWTHEVVSNGAVE